MTHFRHGAPLLARHPGAMLRFIFCIFLMALPAQARELQGLARIVDGDTLHLADGPKIRLHGIDAPELSQTCRSETGESLRCGMVAAGALKDITRGVTLRCEALDRDPFGRTVAKCFANGEDIGRIMVRRGFAKAYRKFAMDYVVDEKRAAIARAGLWSTTFLDPEIFRATGRIAPIDASCKIKGNISRNSGQRIYHMPGQRDYTRTRIDPRKGERCFTSEADARAAGWRRARR